MRKKESIKSLAKRFRLGIILLGLVLVLSIASDRFLQFDNISNVLWSISIIGIMSTGAIYPIITGGVDLSVGAIVGFTCCMFGVFMTWHGINFYVVLVMVFAVAIVIGLFNGFMITLFNLPPFIVTIATLNIIYGIGMFLIRGETIGILEPADFIAIGLYKIFSIPAPVYIMLALTLISYWILNHSKFGRNVVAVGGNRVCAQLTGVRVKRTIIYAYLISSIYATVSGIVMASLMQQARSTMGKGFELDVITAIVLGGTQLQGGRGSIFGALFGAILVGLIINGMTLLSVPASWHDVVKGIVILMAITLDNGMKGQLGDLFKSRKKMARQA